MKRPNTRRNLDLALQRIYGSGNEYLRVRAIMANTIVGQMLPNGAVKGGSAIKMQLGNSGTRFTTDLDIALASDLIEFIYSFSKILETGWNGFSGRVVTKEPAKPKNVPEEYVMQPFEVKLNYINKPWLTVALEIGHNELGDADDPYWDISEDIVDIFLGLGFPAPEPVALMPVRHQVAQKLHGASEPGSDRVHDVLDLQVILSKNSPDLGEIKDICERLFAYRKKQTWPPTIVKGSDWDNLYLDQIESLDVLQSVDEAIIWANELIAEIENCSLQRN